MARLTGEIALSRLAPLAGIEPAFPLSTTRCADARFTKGYRSRPYAERGSYEVVRNTDWKHVAVAHGKGNRAWGKPAFLFGRERMVGENAKQAYPVLVPRSRSNEWLLLGRAAYMRLFLRGALRVCSGFPLGQPFSGWSE